MQDLANERFAGGQIAIGLHPHRADRLPLPAADALFYALPDLGIVGLHPRIVLRLRADEHIARILLHVVEGGGEGARAFSNRLAERPKPSRIDVRMANGRKRMDGVAISAAHHSEDGGGDLMLEGSVVVEFVDRFVQGITQLRAALGILRQRIHRFGCEFEIIVEVESPGFRHASSACSSRKSGVPL